MTHNHPVTGSNPVGPTIYEKRNLSLSINRLVAQKVFYMDKDFLTEMAKNGKSITDIANESGKAKTTVRYWLKQYNLKTSGKSGGKKLNSENDGTKKCAVCALVLPIDNFRKRSDRDCRSPYCKSCEIAESIKKQAQTKKILVEYKGGSCTKCGGQFSPSSLAFHHIDPSQKDFSLSEKRAWSVPRLIKEVDKCILVCHNCHAEIHNEITNENGYKNKIKYNSERWTLMKQVHLDWIGRHSCDCCGYSKYQGALCIIMPDGVERRNTIYINSDDYGNALKQANIICLNCLKENR
jgi:transposase-like protein